MPQSAGARIPTFEDPVMSASLMDGVLEEWPAVIGQSGTTHLSVAPARGKACKLPW